MTRPHWHLKPVVFIAAKSCPFCRCKKLITIRSERGGDGSLSRKSVCDQCSGQFVLVLEDADDDDESFDELPESGKLDF